MVKNAFFSKESTWHRSLVRKCAEMDQRLCLFCQKLIFIVKVEWFWSTLLAFLLIVTRVRSLDGLVVIVFRSNFGWPEACQRGWGSSNLGENMIFFFSLWFNFLILFMYIYVTFNPNQESKILSNLWRL